MLHRLSVLLLASSSLGLTACRKSQPTVLDMTVSRALVPIESCSEVGDAVRERLAAAADRALDRALERELKAREAQRSNGWDPCRSYAYDAYDGDGVRAVDTVAQSGPVPSSPQPTSGADSSSGEAKEGASEYSETNNQVRNVDEADIIKTDGHYVYTLSKGALNIVDAYPPEAAHLLASLPISGRLLGLFVDGDVAVVYASISRQDSPDYGGYSRSGTCTYGYDCDFSGDGRPTRITVLDVSDRAHPTVKSELDLSASYITARRIGREVHTVAQFSSTNNDLAWSLPYEVQKDTCASDVALENAVADLKTKNRILLQSQYESLLPSVTRRDYGAGAPSETRRVPCDKFHQSQAHDAPNIMTVVSFNLDGGETTIASVIGQPGPIYASAQSLYLASRYSRSAGYAWNVDGIDANSEELSNVHRFDLGSGYAQYVASGALPGRVLNQFAMDEYEGHLRVASTLGRLPGPTDNRMTVLRQDGDTLEITGEVRGLAPGEDIRAVRFDGGRAFVVTFKKTDPLYYFDLSDPAAPRVTGELKIPGFSTYMHMLDEHHLLTIGYDADDMGSFAYFDGVLLQIFDVSNPAAPAQAFAHVIGTRGSSSEALTNHLAFNYFAPKATLALPMSICEGGGDGSYGSQLTFSGTMVFGVSAQTGIEERTRLAVGPQTTGGTVSCYNWWTQASSFVRRTIIMDDDIWSLTNEGMVAHPLAGGEPKSSITF